MPNYIEYHKSVAAEFKSYENRVRNIIDDHHWGEEGRYKEIILMNFLKRILPKNFSVGTGFVKNKDSISNQIDIIIYENSFPLLFSEGEFVIAFPDNVVAIIEVKTNIRPSEICGYINRANQNAETICGTTDKPLFNGIFSYNGDIDHMTNYYDNLDSYDFSDITRKQHFNQICFKPTP